MTLRVIGAGLGRTGTNSLKVALEQLLGGRCYHMYEVAQRPADVELWQRAVDGEAIEWDALLGEYAATVDWPACAFWRELHVANPDAWVLLSTRDSPRQWWESMRRTIVPRIEQPVPADEPDTALRRSMIHALLERRFTSQWRDRDAAIDAYERHNAEVRAALGVGRLIDWRAGEGWAPICAALQLAVPEQPFPHLNTSAEFGAAQSAASEQPSRSR